MVISVSTCDVFILILIQIYTVSIKKNPTSIDCLTIESDNEMFLQLPTFFLSKFHSSHEPKRDSTSQCHPHSSPCSAALFSILLHSYPLSSSLIHTLMHYSHMDTHIHTRSCAIGNGGATPSDLTNTL